MKFAVVAHQLTETNVALAARGWRGARSYLLPPRNALLRLAAGDVALNRLDVTCRLVRFAGGLGLARDGMRGVRELPELARQQISGLLADVHGVVADSLQCS
jgi:hypothetical protein